jgi:hypothetical protein
MIGMLICGLLQVPRPADAPADPPPAVTAAAVQPVAAGGQAATAAPAILAEAEAEAAADLLMTRSAAPLTDQQLP